MNYFLVGPDKKSFFNRHATWHFADALDAAQDGDVIEIEQGFCPINEQDNASITISKSITIQGHVEKSEAGTTFTNIIDAVFITGGAHVTLKDLCIQKRIDKSNNLSVKQGSTLTAENLYVVSTAPSGEAYPVIFMEGQSKAEFTNVQIDASEMNDPNFEVYAKDSTLNINQSQLNVKINLVHSNLNCQQTDVNCTTTNALWLQKQNIATIESSTLTGGLITKKTAYPCVRVADSQLNSKKTVINQPNYRSALYATNSQLSFNDGRIDSLSISNTTLKINETLIRESMAVQNNSHITAKRYFIAGRDNGQINLFLSKNSTIAADRILFGAVTNPNIKMERNVDFKVKYLRYYRYDADTDKFSVDEQNHFIPLNIKGNTTKFGDLTAYEKLNDMTGIQNVKNEVNEFIAIAEMNKKRKDKGLGGSALTLHSLFLGNPGTGKTTVARLLGSILYEKRIIANQNFVETSRSDLVGQYVGETAIKTRKILESALGGVLFIDEAYTLASGSKNDFGSEAIDEILKFMEDHRSDIVIIFAGYTDSMAEFLQMNEGLKSRIPNSFTFEDYTPSELVSIGLLDLKKQKYRVDESTYTDLVKHNYDLSDDHSNGRWIRNLNELVIRKMAVRIAKNDQADLSLITEQDLNATRL